LPEVGVTAIREMWIVSCEDITPRSSLLQTHASIPFDSPLLRPKPRSRSICRFLPAPAAGGTLPTLSLRILPWVLGPLPRRFRAECTCLFLPPRHRPSPVHYRGRLPALTRRNDFPTDLFFGTAAISLCSGPHVCSPPRSFLPLRLIVTGQPRLLRPSRTCFVASTCIGHANHPPMQLVVWGLTPHKIHSLIGCSSVIGDITPTDKPDACDHIFSPPIRSLRDSPSCADIQVKLGLLKYCATRGCLRPNYIGCSRVQHSEASLHDEMFPT
jgi:hypothetical protein